MMKVLFFVIVSILGVANANAEKKKDHNHDAHNALCDLMKAAVGRWGDGGKDLSEPMRNALNRTIFGYEGGKDIENLRKNLPSFYDTVSGSSAARSTACGGHQSGHSAPYDMVCLCTAGEKGWPLNAIQTATTLCGQSKTALGGGVEGWSDERWSDEDWSDKGWSDEDRQKGQKELNATWSNVVSPCLEGDIGKDLKEALEKFKGKLVNKSDDYFPSMYQLGQGEPHKPYACTGYPPLGVCVMYYNSTKTMDRRPWWVDLQNAIPGEEKFQEEKKKREEEERRKQQEEAAKQDLPQAAALRSSPTTNQTNQQHKELNLTTHFQRLNMTSGTSISLPSSWLLSVAILV